jgi:hypothetical protein
MLCTAGARATSSGYRPTLASQLYHLLLLLAGEAYLCILLTPALLDNLLNAGALLLAYVDAAGYSLCLSLDMSVQRCLQRCGREWCAHGDRRPAGTAPSWPI